MHRTKQKPKARKPVVQPPAEKPRAAAKPKAAAKPQGAPSRARADSLFDSEMPATSGAPAGRLDLMSEAVLTADAAGSPLSSTGAKRWSFSRLFARKPKVRLEAEEEKWGSSLMLVGGGGLLLIVILGVVLVWAILRGDADKTFQLANDDYRAGSYAQSINAFKGYLEKYPKDSHASLARVKIGLAELRGATQTGNWPSALQGGQ